MFSLHGISSYFSLGDTYNKGIERTAELASDLFSDLAKSSKLVFNFARKSLKSFAKQTGFSTLLDDFQAQRSQEVRQAALNRNNAKTNQDIAEYHKSIQYSTENKDGIFQYHKASGYSSKKLVIMIMGNGQGHGMSENDAGVLKMYLDLKKQNKHDLLLLRVGDSSADLKYRFGLTDHADLNTDIVYEHISNLIEDRNKSRGLFTKDKKPEQIDIVGFSWGAGVEKNLEKSWDKISNGVKKVRTVSIDGIEYGCDNFGDEICYRPEYSSEHLNIFQNNEYMLNGEANLDCKNCDQVIDVNSIDPSKPNHDQIDDSAAVQKHVLSFVND